MVVVMIQAPPANLSVYLKFGRCGLVLIAVWGMWLRPDTSAGWILLLMCFAVVLLERTIRCEPRLCLIIWITIAAHAIVAGVDAFLWNLPVAAPDASTFHSRAVEKAAHGGSTFGLDYVFYENLLAVLYALGDPSRWLGNMFSVFLYSLSCVILGNLIRRLQMADYQIPVVLVFGLLPSALLLSSVTLRESWEILFFMLCIYAAISALDSSHKLFWMLFSSVAAVMMGLPHKALLLYSVFLVPLVLGYVGIADARITRKMAIAVVVSVTGILLAAIVALVTLTKTGRELVFGMVDGNLVEEIRSYRQHVNDVGEPRTQYDVEIDVSSYLAIGQSIVSLYFHYFFAASIQGLETMKDYYALLESALRVVLLGSSVVAAFRLRGQREAKTVVMLLLVYFSLTMLWSIGTTNYGQAIRHHVLTNWILILLGVPVLRQFTSRLCKR